MTTTFPRTMGYGLGASLQRGASAFGPWVDPYDHPLRDQAYNQTMVTAPSFPPFKFEPRRSRIDWRLLHGIDINSMIRDVDLDTLERIVNIVAFGDIEAEDTRHLTELNFIKIFRLSQMMIEYLLYVQDCLQSSNTWLQQDRSNMDKYVQAARLRIRELEANLKMNKRELRRSRKTIKTYELLAVLNDGKGTAYTATMPPGGATATVIAPPAPAPAPQQPQVARSEPNPMSLAMEALLRKELAVLGERLGRATMECTTLRVERDELYQAVKDLEASVKARAHLSGPSSPPLTYSRQNAEAAQTIQGLQDQLSKATVEIAKLRNEKSELSEELERTNAERRQLQDEKNRLLSELAARPSEPPRGGPDSPPPANENLGSMLLEADRQKAALQDQLSDAKAEITALQKQLMKAMKATALGTLPPTQSGPDERPVRELEAAKAQLQRDLLDMQRTYTDDVQQLQAELEAAQTKLAAADRRIAELQAAQREASPGRSGPPQSAGGFVKVVEERRSGAPQEPDYGADRQRALAEYEATNERLNQQLIQLKGERNTLAGEVEQLRLQLQNRASPPQGDRSIGRDWRMEEIDRLKDERDAAHRRIGDLDEALRDRDALVERLRATIRDLQAQLEASREQQASAAEAGASLVKQQVQHFERLADPGKPPKVQSSFSFTADSPPAGATSAETPTSLRKPPAPELPAPPPHAPLSKSPPRSPARPPAIPEEPERTSAGFLPPPQAPEPSQDSRWLRRTLRPTQAEALNIQRGMTRRVAGVSPEALDMMLQEEIRVITENPFEYDGDDEERFRALMPHEMEGRRGVRSVRPHVLEDLATARSAFNAQLLAVLDDELAQYGVDPTGTNLSDKAYLACMQELANRRSQLLQHYPKDVQERAEELRNFLLTHLEIIRRDAAEAQRKLQQQQLQQQLQQQKLLQQQQQQQQTAMTVGATVATAGADSDDGATEEEGELEPNVALPPQPAGVSGSGALQAQRTTPRVSADEPALAALVTPNQGLAAAAEAAARPLSTTGEAVAQRQLPAFPSRQASLQRSNGTGERDASMDDLRNMLPAAPVGSRPTSGTTNELAASQRSAQGRSAHVSSEASEQVLRRGDTSGSGSGSDRHGDAVTQMQTLRSSSASSGGASSDSDARQQSLRSGQSLPRSVAAAAGTSDRPQASGGGRSGGGSHMVPTPVVLHREVAQSGPERVTLGHARPTPVGRAGAGPGTAAGSAAAAAATPGGNMNMSIRSVKYQESDFDDDEEEYVTQLPQPKPVRRLADEDEYALTEDEETQQDMGIQDSVDFSAGDRQPKMLINTGASPVRPMVPSRLGTQPTPATTQKRGWATDEPLQPAPAKPRASPPVSESAEVELLDSIHSFDNPNNQSIKRSPGAWGSPSGTMRKSQPQGGRESSMQMSVASKHSGWNEAITSFAPSTGDDVQAIKDFNDSFTEARPVGRFMGQQPSAPEQAASPQPRTISRRRSFDSEVSEIEYA